MAIRGPALGAGGGRQMGVEDEDFEWLAVSVDGHGLVGVRISLCIIGFFVEWALQERTALCP